MYVSFWILLPCRRADFLRHILEEVRREFLTIDYRDPAHSSLYPAPVLLTIFWLGTKNRSGLDYREGGTRKDYERK